MKKIIDIFLRSLLTGVAIAIGGTVYLSCPNKYLGAFLFGIGLFVILSFSAIISSQEKSDMQLKTSPLISASLA